MNQYQIINAIYQDKPGNRPAPPPPEEPQVVVPIDVEEYEDDKYCHFCHNTGCEECLHPGLIADLRRKKADEFASNALGAAIGAVLSYKIFGGGS